MDQDSISDEIPWRGPQMFANDPAERFGSEMQPLGLVGGRVQSAVIFLD